ncbi:P-loop containing nucleoside triphosphate hydrolase protein [Suillus paluster]|uniref:P-loop containing nucleoside triphosphate hydrolase protein n=1 Tax=Suillus paluster TaxID=48578 RepID=UPI001B85E4A2|nr:P-loop containing nucleoside triphosphate hydrolase protein [Suillus paluster]KAG1756753.1 P-loop containing nucleoside triphosphate hydrolase protein [Suillus paluster]
MAARRLPTSRSRTNPAAPTINTKSQSSMSKPKSVMSTITSPTIEEHPEHTLAISSSLKGSKSHGQDVSETHIQVAIRCRRRSDREIQENSPIIVSSNGAKSQEVTIETSAPVSSLGVVTLPPTRTYPFDLVFGPEADQAMIYHDVVSPMLDEVLMGYNCTLFAYGQTGTGKTYTMQGDLTPTPMGNPSSQAGMIPRVLFRLFHQLETSATDYSVKISFVELYNEELRDLLANELSAPAGSTQPMGKGGPADNQVGLKIFDDASKKGVFIQGLEEIPVKDAADALALLTKGSHRRQIAATKFNDHSSRSHSVFSITIHIKETSTMGDDLLKVGKFNLVDLAGSENIGRSGAENKRAREAGMINQSLLTLGRVINALVERSTHVPYRESKLTRLLQDSLGGRTKTCIIATISPARSNMEETLSTLDYAIRAKSIRNKPEINQRMTRNSLLKEYVAEIERLKADVLAAREKNGIFFSEETWNQLTTEQELKQTEMEEAKKQVEIVESQLRSVREEFEQSIAMLMKTDGELKETKEKLKETEGELEVKESQLKVVKGAFEEEVVVRQAYQVNEEKLDGVALGLKQVAAESIDDIGALFEKLQRKNKTFTSNIKAVSSHGRSISSEVQSLSTKLEEFIKTAGHSTQTLRAEAKQFQTKELEILTSHSERIDQQLQRIQDSLRIINAKDDVSAEALAAMQNAVKESQETMKSSFSSWSDGLRTTSQTMCKELCAANQSNFASLENALKTMGTLVDSAVSQAIDFVKAEEESALQAKTLVDDMSRAKIVHLQAQNALLVQILEAEKVKSARASDELVQRVSGLLGDFVASRDHELREAFGAVAKGNAKSEEEFGKFGQRHERLMNEATVRGSEAITLFERRGTEGKRTRDGALKTVGSVQAAFKDGLLAMHNSVTTATTTYTGELQRQSQTLQTSFGAGLDRHNRAKRARIESTNGLMTDVQTEFRHLQRGVASSSRNVEGFSGHVVSESTSLSDTMEKHSNNTASRLASLYQTARALLDQGTREDVPTGMTPRKRIWEYVDQWELTQSRDAILQSRRQEEPTRHVSEPPPLQHPQSPAESLSEQMEVESLASSDLHECEPQTPVPSSHLTVSLSSSLTSSTATLTAVPVAPSVIPQVLKKPATLKSGLPTMGALVDRPPNTLRPRGSRRIR